MQSLKDKAKFGAFVVFVLAAGVFVLVTLAGLANRVAGTKYFVAFDLQTGAMGLKDGSLVRVGGQNAGEVKAVRFEPASGPPTSVVVEISVDRKIPLAKDAQVILETPLLGSVSTLNFYSAGRGEPAPAEHNFTGKAAPGLLAQAGINRTDVENLLANANQMTVTANKILKRVDDRMEPILTNVEDATGNAREITSDLRSGVKRWTPKIDRTMDNVSEATTQINDRLAQAQALIGSVQDLITANRPRIDAISESLREIMDKVNNQTLPQVARVLTQGERGVTAAADALDNLRTIIREEEPNIRLMLANLRLASDQLKLTIAEVRRNPWRLLYQPGSKELEREMLYEASRTYAASVNELRATSATLQSVSAGGSDPASKARVDALVSELKASYDRYKKAEDEFLKRLLEEPKP